MMTKRASAHEIPVIMFHSIADHLTPLPWKPIICSTKAFDAYLSHLKKAGYRSLSLSDYIACLLGESSIPGKAVVITFDDGYLDNWVNAYPLLRKYGFCATVAVTTDFIDPGDTVRKTLDDYWAGRIRENELDWYGYLSWNEMRLMSDTGVFEIASHARTHTWYFSSSGIVDFHHPGDPFVWLEWNLDPAHKPFWMKRTREGLWGAPVYTFGPALTTRIYTGDGELERTLVEFVRRQGGESFFERSDWREVLNRIAGDMTVNGGRRGSYENEQDYRSRIADEVLASKAILEKGLGKGVLAIAWPNDAYDSFLMKTAHAEADYKVSFTVDRQSEFAADYPSASRIFIGEKFDSVLFDRLWFTGKMMMTGNGMAASILRSAAGARKCIRSRLGIPETFEGDYEQFGSVE